MAKVGMFKKWEHNAKNKSAPAFDPFAPEKTPRLAARDRAFWRQATGLTEKEYAVAEGIARKKRERFHKEESDLWK